MSEKAWIITTPEGKDYFEDYSQTYEEAHDSAVATFGEGTTVRPY